jgi:hypothetical protein
MVYWIWLKSYLSLVPLTNTLLCGRSEKTILQVMYEWVSDCCLMPIQHFFSYIMERISYFQWDDDEVHFVLDQHASLDFFNSANSLKQPSADRHVTPLGYTYIILITSQPVFALSP